MKRFFFFIFCLTSLAVYCDERIEPVAYGDMEQWVVRYIKESRIIGGKTRVLYAIAPTDTIRKNVAFDYVKSGSPWTVSSAYAKVSGVEKASGSVSPERRGGGWCCRLDSKMDSVIALGIIKVRVMVAGTIFTGATLEPVTSADDPYGVVDMGVRFTKRPVAMLLDYKAKIDESDEIVYAKASSKVTKKTGRDAAEMYILLQRRWEDKDGKLHAMRVGTGYERVYHSTNWKNDHRIPIYWGDAITRQSGYKDYMGVNGHVFKARNSKGEMTLIKEEGYSEDNPTHMIIVCSSGCYEAFVGHPGNTLWVDNIRLVYKE